jgi:hypothetical protein
MRQRAKQLSPSSKAHLGIENDKRIVYRRLPPETQLEGPVNRAGMQVREQLGGDIQ